MRRSSVALLLFALLGACGTSKDSGSGLASGPDRLAAVHAAAAKTQAAKSARLRLVITFAARGRHVEFTGEGGFDFVRQRGSLEMYANAGGTTFDVEERLFPGAIYIKMSGTGVPDSTPRKWQKLDPKTVANATGLDPMQLEQYRQADPSMTLGYLTGLSSDIEVVGTDKIDGARATHYRGTLDLAGEESPLATDRVAALRKMGLTKLPIDAWIDDQGRARRTRTDMDLSTAMRAAGLTGKFTMSMQMDLSDFGAKIVVQRPPAADVIPFTGFASQ